MYSLHATLHFLRDMKRLRKKNPAISSALDAAMQKMKLNPFAKPLKTHKAIAKRDGKLAMSSHVTDDLRIIWRFNEDNSRIIDLIDLGGHSGKGKVYK